MKHHHYFVSIFSLLILGLLVMYSLTSHPLEKLKAGSGDNVSGWAWSSNIGWVSFNCTNDGSCGSVNYGARVDPNTGLFSGQAWSSNIGWISFDSADLVGCPAAPCEARVDVGGAYPKAVSGWARALGLANFPGGGWMSLRGDISSTESYGVYLEDGGEFSGWSWEEDMIGWLSWSDLAYEVRLDGGVLLSPSLNVFKEGSGGGTVTGPGIDCGSDCSETYSPGTEVTLTATPDSGSSFAGWSLSCSGTGACNITMDNPKTVGANFVKALTPGGIQEVRPQ